MVLGRVRTPARDEIAQREIEMRLRRPACRRAMAEVEKVEADTAPRGCWIWKRERDEPRTQHVLYPTLELSIDGVDHSNEVPAGMSRLSRRARESKSCSAC